MFQMRVRVRAEWYAARVEKAWDVEFGLAD